VQCTVYGCGPTPLLHATQCLVADVNAGQRKQQAGAAAAVRLHFERKTYAL
jgi:hypothetical protein